MESNKFQLQDNHVEILKQHFDALQEYYLHVGSIFCDLMESAQNAKNLRKSLSDLQEDICKELEIPRAKKLSWNLGTKTVEVIST